VRASMQGNRSLDTKPEQALRSLLHRRGFRFRKHSRSIPSLACKPDVVFPRERVAVFVDGCFWHGCPAHGRIPRQNGDWWALKLARNRERDERNTVLLEEAGWLVIRAWSHEPPEEVATKVAAAVQARRA
jgi:DNA mismatch endonuclease Vsr